MFLRTTVFQMTKRRSFQFLLYNDMSRSCAMIISLRLERTSTFEPLVQLFGTNRVASVCDEKRKLTLDVSYRSRVRYALAKCMIVFLRIERRSIKG